MLNNITSLDKVIRFLLATAFMVAGIVYHPLFALLSVGLFLSATTNSCYIYKMLGINHKLEEKNHYLSILPQYNPEPVLLFCDQGNLLFRNDAAKKYLHSLQSYKQLALEQSARELIALQREIALRYEEDEKTYQLVLRGNTKENFLMLYGFDISLIVLGEKRLKKLALNDPLTQMANRKQLILDIQTFQDRAITLLDIKNFGQINAFYGHEIGDRFLQSFAKILTVLEAWEETSIYRVQSDIFAIFSKRDANYTQKLEHFFKEQYLQVDEMQFVLEVTMGHAMVADAKRSLLTMAETALMEAKKRSLHTLEYAQLGDITAHYLQNLEWSKRIKHILNGEDNALLVAYFQPIYNTNTAAIEKYETLARVVEGEKITPPLLFLDPAKQLGLLPKITHAMLRAILQKTHQSDAAFSINITMQDLRDKSFTSTLLHLLSQAQIGASRIVLEILEDEEVYEFLYLFKELKGHGFKIAIDDFGTGYSNFAKLQQIEVDYIKIDGSLIKSIETNPQHLEVVRTINNYAHSIGAKTIAEFVSNDNLKQILIKEKIDYLQGYAIGEPRATLIV